MKNGSVVFLAACLVLLSAARSVAVTDLGPGAQAVQVNNAGQERRFVSNALLVKFTPQGRAHLRVAGEEVNPAATGRPALDAICREHRVNGFRSVMAAGAHADAAAAIG